MSKSSPELRPRAWDGAVVLLVLLLAVGTAVWFYGGLPENTPTGYIITHGGVEIANCTMNEPRTIEIDGTHHLTVVCDGESVTVTESDCPTQDCVRTGSVSRPGQSIVCLPEQVVIKVVGMKTAGPDLVIG